MIHDAPSYSRYACNIIILYSITCLLFFSFWSKKCDAAWSLPIPASSARASSSRAGSPDDECRSPDQQQQQQQHHHHDNHYYIALYKPALTLCTFRDDQERSKRKHREVRSTLSTVLLDNSNNNNSDDGICCGLEGCSLPPEIIIPMSNVHDSDNNNVEDGNDNNNKKNHNHRRSNNVLLLHACGRLDRDSEGLLLLTTDGKFTSRVCCDPSAEPTIIGSSNNKNDDDDEITTTTTTKTRKVPKRYMARVKNGVPNDAAMERMRAGGLVIRGATTLPPLSVRILREDDGHSSGDCSALLLRHLPPPIPGMGDRRRRRRRKQRCSIVANNSSSNTNTIKLFFRRRCTFLTISIWI